LNSTKESDRAKHQKMQSMPLAKWKKAKVFHELIPWPKKRKAPS
jgi:hypothetical protein